MSVFTPSAGLYLRFRSKIDAWLGGVVLLGILVSGAMAIGLLLQRGIASLAIVPILAAGLALWLLIETWYDITGRLEVSHSSGSLAISPADKAGFIRALKERNAAVAIAPVEQLSVVSSQKRLLKSCLPKTFVR